MEIPITKSVTIGQRPRPKSEAELGFGKYFTDHMFMMDYEKGKGWITPGSSRMGPSPWIPRPWYSITARRFLRG